MHEDPVTTERTKAVVDATFAQSHTIENIIQGITGYLSCTADKAPATIMSVTHFNLKHTICNSLATFSHFLSQL